MSKLVRTKGDTTQMENTLFDGGKNNQAKDSKNVKKNKNNIITQEISANGSQNLSDGSSIEQDLSNRFPTLVGRESDEPRHQKARSTGDIVDSKTLSSPSRVDKKQEKKELQRLEKQRKEQATRRLILERTYSGRSGFFGSRKMKKAVKEEMKLLDLEELEKKEIFGVSLEEIIKREGGSVPSVVKTCIAHLEDHELQTVGLLRVPGNLDFIHCLQQDLNNGKVIDLKKEEASTVAGLLKAYLRALPEKLVSPTVNSEVVALFEGEKPKHQNINERLRTLIYELPLHNFNLLKAICKFLSNVAHFSDINKMTPKNLITCIAPTLDIVPALLYYPIQNASTYKYYFQIGILDRYLSIVSKAQIIADSIETVVSQCLVKIKKTNKFQDAADRITKTMLETVTLVFTHRSMINVTDKLREATISLMLKAQHLFEIKNITAEQIKELKEARIHVEIAVNDFMYHLEQLTLLEPDTTGYSPDMPQQQPINNVNKSESANDLDRIVEIDDDVDIEELLKFEQALAGNSWIQLPGILPESTKPQDTEPTKDIQSDGTEPDTENSEQDSKTENPTKKKKKTSTKKKRTNPESTKKRTESPRKNKENQDTIKKKKKTTKKKEELITIDDNGKPSLEEMRDLMKTV